MHGTEATVIATYSRRARLQFGDGGTVDARMKGKTLRAVCGDVVITEPIDGEDDWLITAITDRRNALTRPNTRGTGETLAANIDVLVVVAAVSPPPDWYIVDRYLCAAEIMRAAGLLVYNKSDEGIAPEADAELAMYEAVGYPVFRTSIADSDSLAALKQAIGARTAILVGQSGVGKSSLINLLSAPSAQKTADISRKTGEGRHTTVTSLMLPLGNGGQVIDSPGVRDFAPAFGDATEVECGYREIHAAGAACRFANCRHRHEPNCAVKEGVDSGNIAARRYESYRRSMNLFERLRQRRDG